MLQTQVRYIESLVLPQRAEIEVSDLRQAVLDVEQEVKRLQEAERSQSHRIIDLQSMLEETEQKSALQLQSVQQQALRDELEIRRLKEELQGESLRLS